MKIVYHASSNLVLSCVRFLAAFLWVASAPLSAQFASCASAPSGSQCLASADVGIGTTSPAYSLDIGTASQGFATPAGTVVFGARGTAIFGTGYATTLLDSLSNSGALYLNSGNGAPAFSITRSLNITNNDYTIYSMRNLVFAPGSLWNSIFSVGNVGIGNSFSAGDGTSPIPPSSLSVAGGVSIGAYATSTTNAGAGNVNVSGSVGIGTQSPGYKLDVQGGQINASGGLCINGSCQTSWPGSGTVTYSGGNVGIGMTSPTEPLVVNGSSEFIPSTSGGAANQTFWINTPKNNITLFLGDANPTNGYSVNDYSADIRYNGAGVNWGDIAYYPMGGGTGNYGNFRFSANGSSVASEPNATIGVGGLYVNGNVGVGTTSPEYPLSVNGTVQAKEVLVNTGWSDYVFDPDYKLTPLSDVAAYVAENHHLPDIPSAKEVEEKGVSLGDMQAKLLAKVEELTLHMIQAEEQSKQLAEQNKTLQERNLDLEMRVRRLEGNEGKREK